MARRSLLARPVATLAAGLLVAGLVQTAPASADVPTTDVSISVRPMRLEVGSTPGPGDSPDRPSDLGRSPGYVDLQVVVSNPGTEPLHGVSIANEVLANGTSSKPVCDKVVWIPQDEPQPAPSDDVVVGPGQSLRCWFAVRGVIEDLLHEDVTTVTALGVDSGTTVTDDAHFWATAQDESAGVGDRVWLDLDRDGTQDAGEPGIAGVRLTVKGPDGRDVPDVVVGGSVGPQVTNSAGAYLFKHLSPLAPDAHYTVSIDPTSAALDGLVPTIPGAGDASTDSSTGSAESVDGLSPMDIDRGLDFGFVGAQVPPPAKAATTVTADATPEPALVGTPITVQGNVLRDGKPFASTVALEFQADGGSSWVKLKDVTSNASGVVSTSVTASTSGSFRFRFAGDDTTLEGVSPGDHVDIRKAATALTLSTPSSVMEASSFTVKGSIRREGSPYSTPVLLERQVTAGGAWSTAASLRSSSAGALTASVKADRTTSYRFRFAGDSTTAPGVSPSARVVVTKKQATRLTINAPGSAVMGTKIAVKGKLTRQGKAFKAPVVLERQTGGGWSKVTSATSSSKGALSVSLKAGRSETYRYRYAGTSTIAGSTSGTDRVTVRKAKVVLAINAPSSVTKGKSITVKGSVKRESKGWKTSALLQFSSNDGKSWSTVKKVKSSSKGALKTSVKPSRTGGWRYYVAGNSTTEKGGSRSDRVTVKPKPPSKPAPREYANCTELRKVYPHGVGKSGARDEVRGSTRPVTNFFRDTATYNLNTKSDADDDGVACEKR